MRDDCMPTEESSGCSLQEHWLRTDHAICRCDASTGHALIPVAYCMDAETAETIIQALRKATP